MIPAVKLFTKQVPSLPVLSTRILENTRILEKHTGKTRLQLYFVCVDGDQNVSIELLRS